MEKIEEYRTRAAQCLSLASRSSNPEEKERLKTMAEVWGTLAEYREATLEREKQHS